MQYLNFHLFYIEIGGHKLREASSQKSKTVLQGHIYFSVVSNACGNARKLLVIIWTIGLGDIDFCDNTLFFHQLSFNPQSDDSECITLKSD